MKSEEGESVKWNYGRQIVEIKDGDFEARVFFDEFTKKELIFDVEVANLGEEEFLLEPEQIYIQTDNGGKVWSFDPEREIFGDQVDRSRQEARNKNTAVAVGVAAVATIVAVAATSDGDGSGGNAEGGFNTANDFVYINTVIPPPPMNVKPSEMSFWEDYALRKTSLEKGYKAGGKVVFPRMDEFRNLTLVIPFGGRELRANFKQRVFQP